MHPLHRADQEYAMTINAKQITKDHIKTCYDSLLSEVIKRHQVKPKHTETFDWAEKHMSMHTEMSELLLKSNKRKEQSAIRLMFALRNNRLPTRKKENETVRKEERNNANNFYSIRRKKYYNENTCPMGCPETENIEHLCECKHSEKFREAAINAIYHILATRNIPNKDIEENVIKWFKNQEEGWKGKYAWIGFIHTQVAQLLLERFEEKEAKAIVIEIQNAVMEAMQLSWRQRCENLFKKQPQPAAPPLRPAAEESETEFINERTIARNALRKKHEKARKKRGETAIARIRALAEKAKARRGRNEQITKDHPTSSTNVQPSEHHLPICRPRPKLDQRPRHSTATIGRETDHPTYPPPAAAFDGHPRPIDRHLPARQRGTSMNSNCKTGRNKKQTPPDLYNTITNYTARSTLTWGRGHVSP
jgi:hypothetical protein